MLQVKKKFLSRKILKNKVLTLFSSPFHCNPEDGKLACGPNTLGYLCLYIASDLRLAFTFLNDWTNQDSILLHVNTTQDPISVSTKFHWQPAMVIHLCTAYGCVFATVAELGSYRYIVHKAFLYGSFQKSLLMYYKILCIPMDNS